MILFTKVLPLFRHSRTASRWAVSTLSHLVLMSCTARTLADEQLPTFTNAVCAELFLVGELYHPFAVGCVDLFDVWQPVRQATLRETSFGPVEGASTMARPTDWFKFHLETQLLSFVYHVLDPLQAMVLNTSKRTTVRQAFYTDSDARLNSPCGMICTA